MSYLGLDIGTSAIKAVLVDEQEAVLATSSVPLTIDRPHPLWSEQSPQDWWTGVSSAVAELARCAPDAWRETAAIGLSGQMHGSVLLDRAGAVLRPAILWNDGRAEREA